MSYSHTYNQAVIWQECCQVDYDYGLSDTNAIVSAGQNFRINSTADQVITMLATSTSLAVMIVMAVAVVVAATTTQSAAILLNSNSNIILAKKIPLAMNQRFLINWVVLLFATTLAIANWVMLLLEETIIIISDQRTAFLLKKKF